MAIDFCWATLVAVKVQLVAIESGSQRDVRLPGGSIRIRPLFGLVVSALPVMEDEALQFLLPSLAFL